MATNDNLAIRALSKALEASVEKSVDSIGGSALAHLLPGVLANPVASVLAAVTKVLISSLLKQTSALETKLDLVISEPLTSATNTLARILTAATSSPTELQEAERQLNRAYDDLGKALSYAATSDSDKIPLIHAYQAFVAALMTGGKPFAELHVEELRASVRSLHAHILELQRELSEELKHVELWTAVVNRSVERERPDGRGAAAWTLARHEGARDRLRRRIEETAQQADNIAKICQLAEVMCRERSAILKQEPG